ncbi:MAG: translation initiation factor IF-2 [Clostridia bacterium]|nr:translation initiation factor IF-2 [Clostridia bacterium]
MAEKKEMHVDNIKIIADILKENKLDALKNDFADFEKKVKEFKVVLDRKLAEIAERKALEAEKAAAEDAARAKITVNPEPASAEQQTNEGEAVAAKETAKESDVSADKSAQSEKTEPAKEEQAEIAKSETILPEQAKPAPAEEVKQDLPKEERKMPSFIVRREYVPEKTDRRAEKSKQRTFTPSDKSFAKRSEGGKPAGAGKRPQNTYVAPPVIPVNDKRGSFAKKNNKGDKNYEEKKTLNKRALIKNSIDVDDFDENKTGYRKFRPVKKVKEQAAVSTVKIEKAVVNSEIIPLKVLSEKIGITAAEITKRLFKEGIMKTINDSVDFDTAAFIADDVGVELELKLEQTAEDVLSAGFDDVVDTDDKLVRRPPVVTVMGHVDHGKTSILDRIRKTNVTAGEAGGITQHIGAYTVSVGGNQITFLDTPGHAAFTAMRARGAQATDIAVLVVAADDGIMPQTVEAINHAKAADVPIIVAVNKIDKPEANIDRVKQQLTEYGLLPEEWGGDAIICPVSAKTGEGFDGLLESINLVAEIKDLKANPNRMAKGVVIEAKLDNTKGPIATVLIQTGTLKVADNVIVGTVTGKIRAMTDDKGRKVSAAGPSVPVSIMGLDDVPNSGDILYAVEQDKLMKLVAEERKNKERENMIKASSKITLDDVFSRIAEGEVKGLNIIVKADVQGSVEAVKQSLEKLSNEEVKVNVIHAAAGAIKESDIMLAESSSAVIIGFNVRPDSNAKQIAERSGVDIKLYRVIYEAIEDVEKALKGMLAPKFNEVYLGKAEVREVFKISGVGQVAGCYVTEGKILRNGKLRIYRDDVMITEGNVLQLKRFKDDVKEVAQGFECGISIEKFNDIKVGDFIECYQVEEEKR